MSYTPKTLLVTGGLGFIGSNYILQLITKNQEAIIINLDAHTYAASIDNLDVLSKFTRYKLINGNILNRDLVQNILQEYKVDTIVNFAAESHVDRSIENPDCFIKTNIEGTYVLLDAAKDYWLKNRGLAKNACRFLHISTDEVFGSCETLNSPSFVETSKYDPRSPYSASKAASNHLVNAYYHTYGLPTVITNCTNNYGPRQHNEKFIPKIINSCLERKPIPIYGDGSNVRDWLYVLDHCEAIDIILHHASVGEQYNISGSNELSNIDVANKICNLMDEYMQNEYGSNKNLIQFVQDRPGHDWRYSLSSQKVKELFNWKPTTNFDIGLRKTIEYYLWIKEPVLQNFQS